MRHSVRLLHCDCVLQPECLIHTDILVMIVTKIYCLFIRFRSIFLMDRFPHSFFSFLTCSHPRSVLLYTFPTLYSFILKLFSFDFWLFLTTTLTVNVSIYGPGPRTDARDDGQIRVMSQSLYFPNIKAT